MKVTVKSLPINWVVKLSKYANEVLDLYFRNPKPCKLFSKLYMNFSDYLNQFSCKFFIIIIFQILTS